MHPNLQQIARRSRDFKPSDIRLVFERLHTHAIKPRMTPEEFRDTMTALGFESAREFGERLNIPARTVESWSRFGLPRDAALLLLALLSYRERLRTAMDDFEKCTQIPLGGFFEDHRLP